METGQQGTRGAIGFFRPWPLVVETVPQLALVQQF